MNATNPPQQPEPVWAQAQSANQRKMYIMAGGAALLLVIVAVGALFKIMRPEAPAAKSGGSDFTQRLPRPEPLSARQEAAAVSREPDSRMFLPEDEPAEEPAPAPIPPSPVAQAAEPEPAPSPPPRQAASGSRPISAPSAQRRGVKLAPRDFNSGGGNFGSFGGGGLGGAGVSAPASPAPSASKTGDLSAAERLGGKPLSGGAAADASVQALKRSVLKKRTGSGPQKSSDGVFSPFAKDPKGERMSDEAGGVKPGWVKLDDGNVIYVLEMSGSISDPGKGSGGGSSEGGTIGGGGGIGGMVGDGAGQVNQAALENAVKAGGGQAVVGGR
jgi:hypothetical protein